MAQQTDAATEAFLETARADLQRQMGRHGRIDEMTIDVGTDATVISAVVVVAAERLELQGRGETLVTAYSDLVQGMPAFTLASAFRRLIADRTR